MKTKTFLWISGVVLLTLALSACSTTGASAPTVAAGTVAPAPQTSTGSAVLTELLPTDYTDALSARNQLALGTLRLEGTAQAITPEQAQTLAFLWQGLKSLSGTSTAASEETAAVQQQITDALSAEQLAAIRDLRLTSADLNAFYEERGIPLPTGDPDNPDAEAGSHRGRNMTEEERAAWRAEREATGDGGGGGGGGAGTARRDALMDAVIALLVERAE